MVTQEIVSGRLSRPDTRSTFRAVKSLVGAYALVSVATMVAIVLLADRPDLVTDAVWVRCTIVAITSLLMLRFAFQAGKGKPRAYLRLRIMSGIMLVAIAVIVALPTFLPLWVRLEQGLCGVILLFVVILANSGKVRAAFAKE